MGYVVDRECAVMDLNPPAPSRSGSADGDVNGGKDRGYLAFFVPSLTTGGAEQVTVNLVNGLACRGYTVDLLLSRYEGTLTSQVADKVNTVNLRPCDPPVFGVASHVPALVSYLGRKEPAALFSHLSNVSVVCLAASRLAGVDTAIIPTEHVSFGVLPASSLKSRIVRGLLPRLYPRADRIIAVSEGVADSIADQRIVRREAISVINNPIDVEGIRDRAGLPVDHEWLEDDSVDIVLFVGRHEQQKDLDTWLRAFSRVHSWNPDARAVIAGEGSCRDDVRALADRLDVADFVSLPGYVDNPYGYMRRADALLLSSRYEGLPTVLIEALACGCPIVATDCPSGPREILAEGQYGRLVPVGDIERMADAVVATLDDPPEREGLMSRADDFRPERILDEYERFIQRHVFPHGS